MSDKFGERRAVLAAENQNAGNYRISIAFGESPAGEDHILEELAWVGAMLAGRSQSGPSDALRNPRWFDDIDVAFDGAVILREVDVA